MRRPRFSIAWLMGIIFVIGVGLAALRHPSKLWASLLFTMTIGVLVVSLLGALFHRGLARQFWAGFAVCGWFYMLLNFGPWFESAVSPYLFTTACLDLIYPRVAAPERTAMVSDDVAKVGLASPFEGPPSPPANIWEHWTTIDNAKAGFFVANDFDVTRSKPFQLIGHSVWALLFAYLGGVIARHFARLGANPSAIG
ncbi:MAG: hypothetical protein ACHRXM_31675 [Isosphaerales bacterium]